MRGLKFKLARKGATDKKPQVQHVCMKKVGSPLKRDAIMVESRIESSMNGRNRDKRGSGMAIEVISKHKNMRPIAFPG